MLNNDEQKRLYYLRRYNRLYKDQIHSLTNKYDSLEEQMEGLKQTVKQLRQENDQLKNNVRSEDTHTIQQEEYQTDMLQTEIISIKKYLKEISSTQKLLLHTDGLKRDMPTEHLIGAVHRPYRESTYSNGLGKELIIDMKEDSHLGKSQDSPTNEVYSVEETNIEEKSLAEITAMLAEQTIEAEKNRDAERTEHSPSLEEIRKQMLALQEQLNAYEQLGGDKDKKDELEDPEELECAGEEEKVEELVVEEQKKEEQVIASEEEPPKSRKRTSALVEQVKKYGQQKKQPTEQPPQINADEQLEKKPRKRLRNLTFRDIQRANQIYSKPSRNMGNTRSSVKRHIDYNVQLNHDHQEEPHIQKLSKNHKKPEINQQPGEEIKAEELKDEKKRNKSVGLKDEKNERESSDTAVQENEQLETQEYTTQPPKPKQEPEPEQELQLEPISSASEQVLSQPKEETTTNQKQTHIEQSKRSGHETNDQTGVDETPSPDSPVQINEEMDTSPLSTTPDKTNPTTNYSHVSGQRTIQPRQPTQGKLIESKHQSSFFKSIWNKLK